MKWLLTLALVALLLGCASPNSRGRSSHSKLLDGAVRCFAELKEQDKLPGFRSSDHGRLETEVIPTGAPVSYPASVSIRASKEGDESAYLYTFVQDTRSSSWRLAKATRSDKEGHLLEQLFPK